MLRQATCQATGVLTLGRPERERMCHLHPDQWTLGSGPKNGAGLRIEHCYQSLSYYNPSSQPPTLPKCPLTNLPPANCQTILVAMKIKMHRVKRAQPCLRWMLLVLHWTLFSALLCLSSAEHWRNVKRLTKDMLHTSCYNVHLKLSEYDILIYLYK